MCVLPQVVARLALTARFDCAWLYKLNSFCHVNSFSFTRKSVATVSGLQLKVERV